MAPPPASGNSALLLEEPLIRTPYELLRRTHRSAQRQVEKDFIAVQSVLNGILKSFGDEVTDDTRQAAVAKLDQAGERVKGLKRKLDDLQPNAKVPTTLRSRLTYLDHLSQPPKDAPQGGVSSGAEKEGDSTVDRYVIDHLLRTGRMKTARALAARKDIESLVDIKLFAELNKIEKALVEKHSCTEALAWCGENRGTLKKTQSDIEFVLRLQEFIELCRKRDTAGAISYARKNLAPWASTHMSDIRLAMTLLAFGERTEVLHYSGMYYPGRWDQVRERFREEFLSLYALPGQSLLALALSAGLSTLRLPSCARYRPPENPSPESPTIPLLPGGPPLHTLPEFSMYLQGLTSSSPTASSPLSPTAAPELHDHPDAPVGNIDCPTCGEDMRVLTHEVPMSHHVNSTLVCRISGEVMDSSNPPMAFPNGYVYSTNALKEMAKNNFDVVTCPRTGESCSFSRLRKVFIS
ncbi:putative negative regulation of gluconeogenesis-related protein [Papiliotrema laurentii]|uniref:Negative regulation of gluconeogenesis-related protein n=1 Tax=Papiliotrema laurentii TaxID=5418 RepID=A0AAD9CY31_PAPLA|nr:putative negative regulation of gluconeogenesis-related protein [Papiliotrema laurentii]